MKLKDLLEVINRWDNRIEIRTGNDMYYDKVEELDYIKKADEKYEGEYKDYLVDSIEAADYMKILIWIYKD